MDNMKQKSAETTSFLLHHLKTNENAGVKNRKLEPFNNGNCKRPIIILSERSDALIGVIVLVSWKQSCCGFCID
jgi:hypothetical protein